MQKEDVSDRNNYNEYSYCISHTKIIIYHELSNFTLQQEFIVAYDSLLTT